MLVIKKPITWHTKNLAVILLDFVICGKAEIQPQSNPHKNPIDFQIRSFFDFYMV